MEPVKNKQLILSRIKENDVDFALSHMDELLVLIEDKDQNIRKETANILKDISKKHPPGFHNSILSYELRTGKDLMEQINFILKESEKDKKSKEMITFEDIGGLEDLKEVIRESIIYPFKNPKLAEEFGIESGGGALFYGPPGCGKTYVVKAAVGECNVPWVNAKISDIVSKYHGETEQNIANLFQNARNQAPSILFIDEIDSLGGRRDMMDKRFEKMEINQLLTEMDGLADSNKNVLIIAATNAPWDVDPALRRTGRFNKMIYVPPPDFQSRIEIFKIHTKKMPIVDNLEYDILADMTEGYSAADIREICKEAKVITWKEAMRDGTRRKVNIEDFKKVISKRNSSLIPWFRMAKVQLERSGEKDLYNDLYKSIQEFDKIRFDLDEY